MPTEPSDAAAEANLAARAKALSSPIRWRILRLCLHEPRTNRELADRLGLNPATMLHHVRTLTNTGYLEAQEPRKGTRGAKEIPYLATRLTWTESDDILVSDVIVRTFLDEIQGLSQDDLMLIRAGLMLSAAERHELVDRIADVVRDYVPGGAKVADPTVERTAWSLFAALHPDQLQ